MKWTNEQKTVIDLRGCNILVSAAAGSGKTAVLIERIVSQVTDPVNPVNIDEFVIVTFTRLAAAQMKEKLQAALEIGGRPGKCAFAASGHASSCHTDFYNT